MHAISLTVMSQPPLTKKEIRRGKALGGVPRRHLRIPEPERCRIPNRWRVTMADFSMDGNRVWCWGFPITENGAFEIQVGRFGEGNVFEAFLAWTRRQDHAGIELRLEVWGCHLIAKLYDRRHWDHEKGEWQQDEG